MALGVGVGSLHIRLISCVIAWSNFLMSREWCCAEGIFNPKVDDCVDYVEFLAYGC